MKCQESQSNAVLPITKRYKIGFVNICISSFLESWTFVLFLLILENLIKIDNRFHILTGRGATNRSLVKRHKYVLRSQSVIIHVPARLRSKSGNHSTNQRLCNISKTEFSKKKKKKYVDIAYVQNMSAQIRVTILCINVLHRSQTQFQKHLDLRIAYMRSNTVDKNETVLSVQGQR